MLVFPAAVLCRYALLKKRTAQVLPFVRTSPELLYEGQGYYSCHLPYHFLKYFQEVYNYALWHTVCTIEISLMTGYLAETK